MSEVFEWARLIVTILSFIFSSGAIIYARIATAKKAAEERVEEIEKRVAKVEAAVEAMPDREAVHQLALSITETSGRLEVISTRMQGLEKLFDRAERIVNRLEEYLLNRNK